MRAQLRNIRMTQHADGMKMKKALFLGIFDPITLAHMDIICRACELVDELTIGVMVTPLPPTEIDFEERIRMVEKAVKELKNVRVVECNGKIDEIIKKIDINIMIRGLRMLTDFENELNIVHTNNQLNYNVDTVFLAMDEHVTNYSSREIRIIAKNHGPISEFLPTNIVDDVKRIYA